MVMRYPQTIDSPGGPSKLEVGARLRCQGGAADSRVTTLPSRSHRESLEIGLSDSIPKTRKDKAENVGRKHERCKESATFPSA